MISFGFLPVVLPWRRLAPSLSSPPYRAILVRVVGGVILISTHLPAADAARLRLAIGGSRLVYAGVDSDTGALVVCSDSASVTASVISPLEVVAAFAAPAAAMCSMQLCFERAPRAAAQPRRPGANGRA